MAAVVSVPSVTSETRVEDDPVCALSDLICRVEQLKVEIMHCEHQATSCRANGVSITPLQFRRNAAYREIATILPLPTAGDNVIAKALHAFCEKRVSDVKRELVRLIWMLDVGHNSITSIAVQESLLFALSYEPTEADVPSKTPYPLDLAPFLNTPNRPYTRTQSTILEFPPIEIAPKTSPSLVYQSLLTYWKQAKPIVASLINELSRNKANLSIEEITGAFSLSLQEHTTHLSNCEKMKQTLDVFLVALRNSLPYFEKIIESHRRVLEDPHLQYKNLKKWETEKNVCENQQTMIKELITRVEATIALCGERICRYRGEIAKLPHDERG